MGCLRPGLRVEGWKVYKDLGLPVNPIFYYPLLSVYNLYSCRELGVTGRALAREALTRWDSAHRSNYTYTKPAFGHEVHKYIGVV